MATGLAIGKIERAEKHIFDLDYALHRFRYSNPYVISPDPDLKGGQVIYRLTRAEPIPREIPILIGDALHNMRSGLDHLWCELARQHAGHDIPCENIGFPLHATHKKYLAAKSSRKKEIVAPVALQWIEDHEPWGLDKEDAGSGGNEDLWSLHCLNNIDKHRLLVAVVFELVIWATGWPVVDRHPYESGDVAIHFGGERGNFRPVQIIEFDTPPEIGDEVFALSPDAHNDFHPEVRSEVVFGEPGISYHKPVLKTLQSMASHVRHIIMAFTDFLAHSAPPERCREDGPELETPV